MTEKIVVVVIPKLTVYGNKTFEELLLYNDNLRRELETRLRKQFPDIKFDISVSENVLDTDYAWEGPILLSESEAIRVTVKSLLEGILSPRSEWMWQ